MSQTSHRRKRVRVAVVNQPVTSRKLDRAIVALKLDRVGSVQADEPEIYQISSSNFPRSVLRLMLANFTNFSHPAMTIAVLQIENFAQRPVKL
jgi:hypothetical protein